MQTYTQIEDGARFIPHLHIDTAHLSHLFIVNHVRFAEMYEYLSTLQDVQESTIYVPYSRYAVGAKPSVPRCISRKAFRLLNWLAYLRDWPLCIHRAAHKPGPPKHGNKVCMKIGPRPLSWLCLKPPLTALKRMELYCQGADRLVEDANRHKVLFSDHPTLRIPPSGTINIIESILALNESPQWFNTYAYPDYTRGHENT